MAQQALIVAATAKQRRTLAEAARAVLDEAEVVAVETLEQAAAFWRSEPISLLAVHDGVGFQEALTAAARLHAQQPNAKTLIAVDAAPNFGPEAATLKAEAAAEHCAVIFSPISSEAVLAALDCCAADKAQRGPSTTALAFA